MFILIYLKTKPKYFLHFTLKIGCYNPTACPERAKSHSDGHRPSKKSGPIILPKIIPTFHIKFYVLKPDYLP